MILLKNKEIFLDYSHDNNIKNVVEKRCSHLYLDYYLSYEYEEMDVETYRSNVSIKLRS